MTKPQPAPVIDPVLKHKLAYGAEQEINHTPWTMLPAEAQEDYGALPEALATLLKREDVAEMLFPLFLEELKKLQRPHSMLEQYKVDYLRRALDGLIYSLFSRGHQGRWWRQHGL